MGMISGEDGKYSILSDILGDEDHLGDMDFKVTGTIEGICAVQMDIKIDGLSYEVLTEALEQANRPEDRALREALAKVLKGKSSMGRLKSKIARRLLAYPALFRILKRLYRRIQVIFNQDWRVKY